MLEELRIIEDHLGQLRSAAMDHRSMSIFKRPFPSFTERQSSLRISLLVARDESRVRGDASQGLPERTAAFGRIDTHFNARRTIAERRDGDSQAVELPGSCRINRVAALGILHGDNEIGAHVDHVLHRAYRHLGVFDRGRRSELTSTRVENLAGDGQRRLAR